MRKPFFSSVLLLILTALLCRPAQSADAIRLVDLRGYWKFEIGDNPDWAAPLFDDAGWPEIFVPANWEDEGFPGYDGYAWYRKHFRFKNAPDQTSLYLYLGRIDDVDEAYLNGHLIGFKGIFPPYLETAYNQQRRYLVPREYLNPDGDNVVAVRVYDTHLAGGIIEGDIGLYARQDELDPYVPLSGVWKFMPGDQSHWRNPGFDDSGWHTVLAPANWEVQGFRGYNGFAWYRKTFYLPAELKGEQLTLLLGKIDDVDETFLNGEKLGGTGRMNADPPRIAGDEWEEVRAYPLPPEQLVFGGENVLAVRIYDGLYDGGIYEGPLGIVSRDAYQNWQRSQSKPPKFWELFEAWFRGQ